MTPALAREWLKAWPCISTSSRVDPQPQHISRNWWGSGSGRKRGSGVQFKPFNQNQRVDNICCGR